MAEGSGAYGGLVPVDGVEGGEGVFFGCVGEDSEGAGSLDGEAAALGVDWFG